MARTTARTPASPRTGAARDFGLLGEPELEPAAVALLAAYRDAAESARVVVEKHEMNKGQEAGSSENDAAVSAGPTRITAPPVPRLTSVPEIENARLVALHGSLIADGYLAPELLGRSDGLAYRVTREGLRRLAGEPEEAAAA